MHETRYAFWLEMNSTDLAEFEHQIESFDNSATVQAASAPHDRAFPPIDPPTAAAIIYVLTESIKAVKKLRDYIRRKRSAEEQRTIWIFTNEHDKRILAHLEDSAIEEMLRRKVGKGEVHD